MYEIQEGMVASWSSSRTFKIPSAVDMICPFCNRKITFSLNWSGINETLMHTVSRCVGCNQSPIFILVDFVSENQNEKKGRLFIHPSPKTKHPIEGLTEIQDFSIDLQRNYYSAINVYNVQEWTATAVLCRRLLEGITISLIPEEKRKGSLYKQIQDLPNHKDLKAPLIQLADAIRKVGNLGAHFDLEKEPNEETVTLMINLLDYLLEYLFILPQKIETLHNIVDNLGAEKQ